MHRVFFLHGGPGLHTEAERHVVAPVLDSVHIQTTFWEEPQGILEASSKDAYQARLESAEKALLSFEQPVLIMAHAFGCNYALDLAEKHPSRVEHLFLVAPNTQVFATFCRLMKLGVEAARETSDLDRLLVLDSALKETRTLMDAPMLQGVSTALSMPEVVLQGWHNEAAFLQWQGSFEAPPWTINPSEQVDVLLAFQRARDRASEAGARYSRIQAPTSVVFGAHDSYISRADEVAYLKQRVHQFNQTTFQSSSHFVQLEEPAALAQWVITQCENQTKHKVTGALAQQPGPHHSSTTQPQREESSHGNIT